MITWRILRNFIWLAACLAAGAFSFPSAVRGQSAAPSQTPNPLVQLEYRFVGPVGNRADAIVGEPGNPAVVYVGAAAGGYSRPRTAE